MFLEGQETRCAANAKFKNKGQTPYLNSPVWVVFSIFPFSSPVLVMLRLGLSGVPPWQLVVSMLVLVGSVAGGLWVAAKLLRFYRLMYGKRPRLRELVRAGGAG
jgi:ABC-2 type transport system permease protein